MSAPTVAELQQALADEAANHAATMATVREQTHTLQSVLAEQQQAFRDLVTRVTNLRVAKGEVIAARTAGRSAAISFDTGSDPLDGLLYAIQEKLSGPGLSVGGPLLQALETAGLEALTPYGNGRLSALFTSNASAIRQTSALVLFPNDVRGVRPWARKHLAQCPTCAARLRQLPPWTPHRQDVRNKTGFELAPDLQAIPGKSYHNFSCTLLQERSMADRMDTEQHLDLIRVTAFVNVRPSGATPSALPNAAAACAEMTQALFAFLKEAMVALRTTAHAAAPWSDPQTGNPELATAMEVLLHMIEPRVWVKEVAVAAVAGVDGEPCTMVQVDSAVSVPLQVSALAPLLELLRSAEHRQYLIDRILTPIAQQVGDALGAGHLVAGYTNTGLRFAEALYRIAAQQGIVSPSTSGDRGADATKSSGAVGLERLYSVLHALAVFRTTIEVEATTPALNLCGGSALSAKAAGLHLAQSMLRHLCPPDPLIVPSPDDAEATDLTVKLTRAPTAFLEILNRTFSSNQRLPPTSRGSALDSFVSPKAKISLALKLFNQIVVDVYRPYHPCTGIVLASENGANGKPRVPPCVPVIDLPVDFITANVGVATYMMEKAAALRALEASLPNKETSRVEKAGKEAAQRVAEALQQTAAVEALRARWAALRVTVVESPKVCVDIVLPFSMTEVDVRAATRPLLYVRAVYEC